MKVWITLLALFVIRAILAAPAAAHIGSPDVFLEGNAGPYRLFVTIRVPLVIPGTAGVEIRSESIDVRQIRIAPAQLTGLGSQLAPTPDVMQRSKTDAQFFSGSLWMMESGSLQVRIQADGARGTGMLAVPVPSIAQRTLPMQKPLGILLFVLMLVLAMGLLSITVAAVREGNLEPGAPTPAATLRDHVTTIVASLCVLALLFMGRVWWNSEARRYANNIYTPPKIDAAIASDGRLLLRQGRIAAGNPRHQVEHDAFSNLIPDHGHLMHLFLIRTPKMNSFWHLHPERVGQREFAEKLPAIPAGHYELFADVVLENGFPVTMVGQMDLPAIPGQPLRGDDSGTVGDPISEINARASIYILPDGGRIIWDRDANPLQVNLPLTLKFRVEDAQGNPATDLTPYMGMVAHAAIFKSDGSVFAHVHPAGSVSMAAFELARANLPVKSSSAPPNGMTVMNMPGDQVDSKFSFPYGFPTPGLYRIFVQVRRSGHIQTASFETNVE